MSCYSATDEVHGNPALVQLALTFTDMVDLFLFSSTAVLMPVIAANLGFGESTSGRITSISMMCQAASKLVNGALVDRLGGRAGVLLCLGGTILSTLLMTVVRSVPLMAIVIALQYFFHAPTYASQTLVVRDSFRRQDYDRLFRWFGMTARFSSFSVSPVLGWLLQVMAWRWTLRLVACVACIFVAFAAMVLLCSGVSSREVQQGAKVPVCSLLRQSWFRWGLLTSSCVTVVCGVQALTSTFLVGTCDNLKKDDALKLAGAFPLGLFASSALAGHFYKGLQNENSKLRFCQALQLSSVVSSLVLCVFASGVTTLLAWTAAKVVLIFMVAFGQAINWYIFLPSTTTKLAREGGAFAYGVLDSTGFACSSFAFWAMAPLLDTELRWHGVWGIIAAVGLVGTFATTHCFLAAAEAAAAAEAGSFQGALANCEDSTIHGG